jgi:hypothetical protein
MAVPAAPEDGLRTSVECPGDVGTVNDADFDSLASVLTVTVYTVLGTAPEATVKLPVSLPPVIEHDCKVKSPPGSADSVHVTPA